MDKPIDFPALAALRPGSDREALSAALGGRWRPPAPHDAGRVTAIFNTYGFDAWLDVTDHIGQLYFRHPFPATITVAGLRIGMSQREALAAFPALRFSGRMEVYAASHYVADLPDRYRTIAEFHGDELYSIGFFVRDAVYPPKGPMVYPPASGAPGAPFRDPNLKLAVLSALIESDALDLATPQDLADFVLPYHVDLGGLAGYHFLREAYDYLIRYPLTDADLARVETITFDGGSEIYRYCFYSWDGETHEFDIDSVEGVARCVNLRSLQTIALLNAIDVEHLVGLDQLEELDLPRERRHLERLLDLPALKRVSPLSSIGDAALIARLRAKGVRVGAAP
ncbi:MAG TPA: hypothetical protein VKX28_05570 [Xanthobacteraceae bacterium]|nr:hypothetical protein [Xanthobacteraceae bacterium]